MRMHPLPWAILLVLVSLSTSAPATTHLVRPDGSGDHPTIQAAIDAAVNGDTVLLADGVYTGPGNRDIDFAGKLIIVRSESDDPTNCIIDCQGSDDDPHRGFHFHTGETDEAILRGITVTGGHVSGYDWGGAVYCETPSSPRLEHCVFSDSYAHNGGGVASVGWDARPIMIDCTIIGNTSNNGGLWCDVAGVTLERCAIVDNEGDGMVFVDVFDFPTIDRCTVSGNTGDGLIISEGTPTIRYSVFADNGGAGIRSYDAYTGLYLSWCTLAGNRFGLWVAVYGAGLSNVIVANNWEEAVVCDGNAGVGLSCCDVWGNAGGDYTGCLAGQGTINQNFSADPRFCNPGAGDYRVHYGSPCSANGDTGCGQVGAHAGGCADVPAHDVIGLYADDAGTVTRDTRTPGLMSLYLVLKNPSATEGVWAWECATPTPDNVILFDVDPMWNGINFATPPQLLVSLPVPVPPQENLVLAELTCYILDTAPAPFFIEPYEYSSFSPPSPGYADADAVLFPLTVSSGSLDLPVFILNPDTWSAAPDAVADACRLEACTPNPCNPATTMTFVLPSRRHVHLDVYDVRGQRVVALVDGVLDAGRHEVRWNGRDGTGAVVASGVYCCRLDAGGVRSARTVTVLK